jgi:hypothetical protein
MGVPIKTIYSGDGGIAGTDAPAPQRLLYVQVNKSFVVRLILKISW